MTPPDDMLDRLCPMHLRIGSDGTVTRLGPTLGKIVRGAGVGAKLFDLFEPIGPRGVSTVEGLRATAGRRLRLRLRWPPRTILVGHFVEDSDGGGVLDLSFGIAVASALREHPLSGHDFTPSDLTVEMLFLIESKSAAMDSAVRLNRQLYTARLAAEERALTDTLTGLRNRRAADYELARLTALDEPFALMQIDLDRFKTVNDTFGHAAGDAVLRAVADILVTGVRRCDIAARTGGDEFLVVVPVPPGPAELRATAERLIQRIESPVPFRGHSLSISASIGIAAHAGGSTATPARLMDAADRALYEAKNAGRGQVVMAQPDLSAPHTATSPDRRRDRA